MPTFTFARTREQLRDMILRKLRVLGAGETPSAEDAAIAYEAMDVRLKELHALGVLWFNVAGAATDLALTSGQATASLTAVTDFLYPVSLDLRINGEDQPVAIVGHRQYHDIPDKTQSGEPEMAFFSGSTVYLWPVPRSDATAKLTYQAIAADTASSTAPDVPVGMLRALAVLCAYDLADAFGVPEPRIGRLMIESQQAMRTLHSLNTERVDAAVVGADYF